jgi:AGCS family alanine or glycine:cation symporter
MAALLSLVSVPASAAGIDEAINNAMQPITDAVSGFIFFEVSVFGNQLPLIVLWLVGASIFFTFYFKFLNLRGFRHAFELLRGDYSKPDHSGELSHFRRWLPRWQARWESATSAAWLSSFPLPAPGQPFG